MVVSIAMLGIGSAGTVLSLHSRNSFKRPETRISAYSLFTSMAIILSYIISNRIPFDPVKLSWERMQILYLSLYCAVFSIPFFFSGILIATVFSIFSKRSESIYASDLLGAGAGSLIVIGLLNLAGPEYAVLTASSICLVGVMIVGDRKLRFLSIIFLLINSSLFILHPDLIDVRISPYKGLSLALKYPNSKHLKTYYSSVARIDTLKSPMIRFAPGLSLTYSEPLPEQIGLAIDGGELNAVTRADDERALRFLKFLPSGVTYELAEKGKVLILEPKGGLHVLISRYYGAKEIHKIESNPLLIEVIKKDLREFTGEIFEHNIWSGFGRNWLHRPEAKVISYDIIDLPMTGASVSGVFGITEDYRYTVEAFKKYLKALKSNGIMSISLYLIPPPRREFRTLTTILSALEEIDIKDTWKNIVAIRSWDTMTILVKKAPFTDKEINKIKEYLKDRMFDLVYYPGIDVEDTNIYIKSSTREYFKGFKNLINPQSRRLFMDNYIFDIKPVHDENPFFHYYLKLKNIKVIYNVMGKKWLYFLEEGYLTPLVFLITFILSVIMILLPVLLWKKKRKRAPAITVLIYFSMLGLGFMFIEVTLIQKHILILENPAYSLAVVLTTILISSGVGSMLSLRFMKLRKSSIFLLLSCLILIYSLIQPLVFSLILSYSLTFKVFIIFLTLIPIGLLMGIPFPMGIKLIGQKDSSLIPWAWATNAFLSVLAPVLTIMLATMVGFKSILWLASLAYLVAYAGLKRL